MPVILSTRAALLAALLVGWEGRGAQHWRVVAPWSSWSWPAHVPHLRDPGAGHGGIGGAVLVSIRPPLPDDDQWLCSEPELLVPIINPSIISCQLAQSSDNQYYLDYYLYYYYNL